MASLKGQLKYDVHNGSRIRRNARSFGGPEADGLGRGNRVFIQAIVQTAYDSEHAHLSGRGKQDLKQNLALDSLAARIIGVCRARFRKDLDGSRDRQCCGNRGPVGLTCGDHRRVVKSFT